MERSAARASGFVRLPRSPVAATRIAAPPASWRFVLAGVHPLASPASRLLFADVPLRIAAIRQGMALADHPTVQIDAVRVARPDRPSELILSAYPATDPASRDHPAERPGRVPAASPGRAVRPPAALSAFEGIDSMQSDPVARDFDGVAVDHFRDAFEHVRRIRRTSRRHHLTTPRLPVRLADLVNGRSRRVGINPGTFRCPEMAMVRLATGMAAVGADFATMAFHLHGHGEGDGSHHAKHDLQPFHRLPQCSIGVRSALDRCNRADADAVWPNGPGVAIAIAPAALPPRCAPFVASNPRPHPELPRRLVAGR